MRYWLLLLNLCTTALLGIETKPITKLQKPVYSVIVYAEMEQEGKAIDLSLIAKDKNKIRATLSNFPSKVTVLHKNGAVILQEEIGGKQIERILTGEAAARQLLEMLGLCPYFFFHNLKNEHFKSLVLEGYTVDLQYDDRVEAKVPEKIVLIDNSTGNTIHSVRFLNCEKTEITENSYQPTRVVINNHLNEQKSEIRIKHVEWNAGLPDFLFNL